MKRSAKSSEEVVEQEVITPEELARAQRLLRAVEEALPHVDSILKTTDLWCKRPGAKSDYDRDPPPLLKQSATWREAVDPETLKQFSTLIDFLRMALFGVDCDNDTAVRFVLRDVGREEDFLPSVRVPRVKGDSSVAKRFHQLEMAKINLKCVQSRVEQLERSFESDLKEIVKRDDRLRKAKNCKTCKGKGWVETDAATWHALDYGEKCRTGDIGCDFRAKPEDKYYKTFRLFCECQKEEEDEDD